VSNQRHARGLVDTSVVIEIEQIPEDALPAELAVSAITFAELAAGPHATADPAERARRQDRLQRAEATFDPIPFDASTARSYGRVYAGLVSAGREARGRRAIDVLIAATALAAELPLYTRNPSDFVGLDSVLEVVGVNIADASRPIMPKDAPAS
jgi:predicted nucleic acid-binding protein